MIQQEQNNPALPCLSCAQSMDGADGVLRCRVNRNALPCSEALAEDCGQYLYEPGTDAAETTQA